MDPLTMGALVGGNVLGSMLGNQNQQIAQQNAFNESMSASNTAYQRSTLDMEKAGLNPALMYGSGAAASSPQAQPGQMGSPLSTGVSSASALMAQSKSMDQQDSQIDNLDSDTENKNATTDLINNQVASTAADITSKNTSNKYLDKSLNAQLKKATAEGDYAQLNQVMGVINAGASSAKSLLSIPNFGPQKSIPLPQR